MGFASLRASEGSKLVRLAFAAFMSLLIAGCGASPGSRTPVVSPPTGALVAWQAFPAYRVPRPIVLFDDLPRSRGFAQGDGKIATMCHRFGPPARPLPSEVPASATASWADGTSVTYPAISATDAYAAMDRPPVKGPGSMCDTAVPLAATAARLGTFGFATDRGTAQMSAWLFTVPGGLGELAYPAIVPPAFWGDEATVGFSGVGTTVSADGLMLTFGFYGAPAGSGPCDADYKGVVAESSSAVAVAVQMIPSQPQSDSVACPAIAAFRTVTVSLARPLGGRVVVDASGAVVEVCPASLRAASPAPGSPGC